MRQHPSCIPSAEAASEDSALPVPPMTRGSGAAVTVVDMDLHAKAAAMRKHTSSDPECYVCLDAFDQSPTAAREDLAWETLPCGHKSHSHCLTRMLDSAQSGHKCGMCRQTVELVLPSPIGGAPALTVDSWPTALRDFNHRRWGSGGSNNGNGASSGGGPTNAVLAAARTSPRTWLAYLSYAARNFGSLPRGVQLTLILAVVVSFGYLVCDRELLPESKYGWKGLIDDVGVLWICIIIVIIAIRRAFSA
jgi:hypothetical protein